MSGKDNTPVDLSGTSIRVLIVDDDEAHAQAVAESLQRVGYDCTVAASGKRAVALIESQTYDVVVTDLMMDEVDGLEILRKSKEELPDAEVILLTGHASIKTAVSAGQHGVHTYLTKPLDITELRHAVEKASSRVRLLRNNAELSRRLDEKFGYEGVIGNSPAMHRVMEKLRSVAPTDSTVLILGESGTGKELAARALHQNSERKNKPFVPLNISALPESLLEGELFGHEPGAFTGAVGRRIGKFEHANGGTLFLDEVGEMPMPTQIKLLRVLEDRKLSRIGMNEEMDVNVRVVAATNADMQEGIRKGTFRKDLYFRLAVVTIELPPLRERRSDIPLLMDSFLKQLSTKNHRPIPIITRQAQQALIAYDWPGNVRELRNTMEGMMILDRDGRLDVDDLPPDIAPVGPGAENNDGQAILLGADSLVGRPLVEVEKYYIQRALELTGGKREEAAHLLEIGERTMYRKIKEYDIKG
ncbi:sigma-54-dependent transcriptional regulator [Schlesneria paludicola]|uniref:sigma-54-dependent transcriptional regulator n=1 Tax=Schlesneria paludicola TaxID=360056 RepID=UPI00029A885A|nr:sigma-54 dependent transcriptional regulator [Schlesneria paludicola]